MNDPQSNKQIGNDLRPESTNRDQRGAFKGRPDDLHNLIAVSAGADEEDPLAALRGDPNYAALLRDLQTIADAARELFKPAEEAPRDEVWAKIQSQLPSKPDA